MSKQTINFGTPPLGIGGDTYKSAFEKCNANFTEVYDKVAYFDGAPKAASAFTIYRDVLSNYRATASLTGALVIHLPIAKNKSSTMLSLRIRGYSYLGNRGEWDLQVGGYNYPSGWYHCSANLNGPAPFTQVQFGMAADHQVIIIGTAGTVWSYPRFNIEELTAGYSNHESGWNTGITAEYETNLSTYTGIITPVLYGWPQVLTAEKLTTPRTIGGVSFDGSANINLPGVNTAGNQNTSGNAATATKLANARTINGVNFDGTANITVADSTKLPLSGGTLSGQLVSPNVLINKIGANASGISWYSPSYTAWQEYMANGATTGNGVRGNITAPQGKYVTTWARRSVIEPVGGYGWTFETVSSTGTAPTVVAEISVTGTIRAVGDLEGSNLNLSGRVNATQFNSPSAYSFLNGSAAQNISVGGLLASNSYADVSKVPTNGIYSKGMVQADGGFQGALTGNASTATKLQTARTINGTSFDGTANVSINTLEPVIIPSGANFNSYTTPGMYYCPANATASTLVNRPTGNAFSLLVEKHAGVKQTVTEYMTSGHKTYIRNMYSGTWGPWYRAYTTADEPVGGQFIGNQATKAISYNAQNISENVTIPGNVNALSAGPITIDTDKTVTISDGATWTIV